MHRHEEESLRAFAGDTRVTISLYGVRARALSFSIVNIYRSANTLSKIKIDSTNCKTDSFSNEPDKHQLT